MIRVEIETVRSGHKPVHPPEGSHEGIILLLED